MDHATGRTMVARLQRLSSTGEKMPSKHAKSQKKLARRQAAFKTMTPGPKDKFTQPGSQNLRKN